MSAEDVDVWMPMFWGDYFKRTRGFSAAEHGAYMCLIGEYWLNGGPLPYDIEELKRLAGLSGRGALKTLNRVLTKFEIVGDTVTHERVDQELAKARARKAKSAERAEKGAAARWKEKRASDASSISEAMPTDASSPSPSPSPSDLTTIVETDSILEVTRAVSPKAREPKKREYAPGVFLTEAEHERLQSDFAKGELAYWLDQCAGYAKDRPGKWRSHKDHNRTIRNWRNMRLEDGKVWNSEREIYLKPFPQRNGFANGKLSPNQVQQRNFELVARIRAEEEAKRGQN